MKIHWHKLCLNGSRTVAQYYGSNNFGKKYRPQPLQVASSAGKKVRDPNVSARHPVAVLYSQRTGGAGI